MFRFRFLNLFYFSLKEGTSETLWNDLCRLASDRKSQAWAKLQPTCCLAKGLCKGCSSRELLLFSTTEFKAFHTHTLVLNNTVRRFLSLSNQLCTTHKQQSFRI